MLVRYCKINDIFGKIKSWRKNSWKWFFLFKISGPNRYIVPFLACGDLSAYDSDKSYPLNLGDGSEYKYHEPVQKPIDPPYKTAIAERRGEDIEKKLEECDINQK